MRTGAASTATTLKPDTPERSVSIVIPVFNGERWVSRAIHTALAQAGPSGEVIVVDDGSTDGSWPIIDDFGNRVIGVKGTNRGACFARNKGLATARSLYILFLDADDDLEGPFVASGVAAAAAAEADLAFGPFAKAYNDQRVHFAPPPSGSPTEIARHLLENQFFPTSATLWRREFLLAIGGWREPLRRSQDFELVFRALAKVPRVTSWSVGAAVAYQHDDPSRISRRTDLRTVVDQADVLRGVRGALITLGFAPKDADRLIWRKAYDLCRQTAVSGDLKAHGLARELWQAAGGRGHQGPWTHVVASTILGLWWKERVSAWCANYLFGRRRRL